MNYQYNGPRYADGPFCRVAVYVDRDGERQTYTDRDLRGTAYVNPKGTAVNTLGGCLTPTWRLLKP